MLAISNGDLHFRWWGAHPLSLGIRGTGSRAPQHGSSRGNACSYSDDRIPSVPHDLPPSSTRKSIDPSLSRTFLLNRDNLIPTYRYTRHPLSPIRPTTIAVYSQRRLFLCLTFHQEIRSPLRSLFDSLSYTQPSCLSIVQPLRIRNTHRN